MLDNQLIDPFCGIEQGREQSFDGPYERVYKRQQARDARAPAGASRDKVPARDVRASLISGFVAIVITVALFLGGVTALTAPTRALAKPMHVIVL